MSWPCGGKFACTYSYRGEHMHECNSLPHHGWHHQINCQIRKFKIIYLLNRYSDYRSVDTAEFVWPRASKLDPLLICFDEIFFQHQLPDYGTMAARLISNRYHDNYIWLLDNFLHVFRHLRHIYTSRLMTFYSHTSYHFKTLWLPH